MKYVRRKDVVARTVAGENLLVPVNQCTQKVFTLNKVGKVLWEMVETPCSKADMLNALTTRYSIPQEVAETDVQVFLDQLVELDLLCVCEE